jgi:hypothetical protein
MGAGPMGAGPMGAGRGESSGPDHAVTGTAIASNSGNQTWKRMRRPLHGNEYLGPEQSVSELIAVPVVTERLQDHGGEIVTLPF